MDLSRSLDAGWAAIWQWGDESSLKLLGIWSTSAAERSLLLVLILDAIAISVKARKQAQMRARFRPSGAVYWNEANVQSNEITPRGAVQF